MTVSKGSQAGRRIDFEGGDFAERRNALAGWGELALALARGDAGALHRMARMEKMAVLGQLISGIAHELNNPLTSILGYAQLLLQSAAPPPETTGGSREAVHILEEAQRAGAIVRNLLLLAREEAPQRKPVWLNEIIGRTIALRRYELRLENIEVAEDLEAALPAVQADPQALQQLVLNLLLNSEQAVAAHGPAAGGRIEIRTRATDDGRVRLEVRDNGPGIPPAILGRVFDPFFTTKPAGVGTGLGLSIVNAIVQSHGGGVRAENLPRGGAAFVVELQALPEAAEPAPGELSAGEHAVPEPRSTAPTRRKARKILVVEDEPTVAQLVADVLREEGHTVVAILDSVAALGRVHRETFDLVICDLKMPRLDGPSFYEGALRSGRTGPDRVLFITGDTLRRRTLEFMEKNGLPFLAKPFTVEELTRAVESILDRMDPSGTEEEAPGAPRSSLTR